MSAVPGSPSSSTHLSTARTFLRSLSIVLKYARLYGFEHARTAGQFETTWNELCSAIAQEGGAGVLIGVAGDKLLIDGVPVDASSGERGVTQLLAAAGMASIHFTNGVTRDDFERLIRAFVLSQGKASTLTDQIQHAVGPESGGTIRINALRFVAAGEGDQVGPGASAAAALAARSLGDEANQVQSLFSDPQKLLQMIAAAHAQPATASFQAPGLSEIDQAVGASGEAGAGNGTSASEAASDGVASEEEILHMIRLFSRFGEATQQRDQATQEGIRQQFSKLAEGPRSSLEHVLRSIVPNVNTQDKTPILVKIAEHLAIRFALERYDRGEVRVNAIREMLDRMNQEVDNLRKVVNAHENKMARAGMVVESQLDILDRQFWAAVPDSGKQTVLLSPDAFCIPPRNIASYVEELHKRGEGAMAEKILQNYADCIGSEDKEARQKTAVGLSQLAESVGKFGNVLRHSITRLGEQLSQEADPELQKLLSASFTRLSREAAARSEMAALLEAMASIDVLEDSLPELANMMRPCLGVHDRLPEFIAEATSGPRVSAEMLEVFKRVPEAALDRLLERFDSASRRDECERIFEVAKTLGPPAVEHLYEKFSQCPPAEAVLAVGMLSRTDPRFLGELLPGRLMHWGRPQHDAVVRQIASAGAADRGKLLLKVLDSLDPVLLPEVIDELGMSGEREAFSYLMSFINHAEPDRSPYHRLKAVEALGRLREVRAAKELQTIVASRHLFHWVHPREFRIAAAQALVMIDADQAKGFVASKGLTADDMAFGPLNPAPSCPWARQRRYARVISAAPVPAVLTTGKNRFSRINVSKLSLGGGIGSAEGRLQSGSEVMIELQAGAKKVRAQIYTRETDKHVSFEFVKMELDERAKLRRMLAEDLGTPPHPGLLKQMTGLRQIRASLF